MTKANIALAALAIFTTWSLTIIHERPNLGGNLVCVDARGRLAPGPGVAWGGDCHPPRNVLEVGLRGW